MTNHGCINGTLDSRGYASPMPIIGLYIAFATLLCLFCMVYDVLVGIRTRKPWLPNRVFSANSLTMSLLSLASMIPVDLTTPMPSVKDQLSKLTGTTIICILMGVFMPSFRVSDDTENLGNISGIFIFLMAVSINVCIQIYNGVIILFIVEHILVLICVWIMFGIMVYSIVDICSRKGGLTKDLLTKGNDQTMLHRLKLCYTHSYCSNPQIVMCKHPASAAVGGLSILCSAVILQAAYRSLLSKQMKFCNGTSDYGWSIWFIVGIQIITIIVGSVVAVVRWLPFVNHMDFDLILKFRFRKPDHLLDDTAKTCQTSLVSVLQLLIVVLGVLLSKVVGFLVFSPIYYGLLKHKRTEDESVEEFEDLIQEGNDTSLDKWTVQRSVKDLKRWMDVSKMESLNLMTSLLIKYPKSHVNREGIQVSSFSLILLARIAEISLPSHELGPSLVKIFNESCGLLYYLADRTDSTNIKSNKKSMLARAVCRGSDFISLVQKTGWTCSTDLNQSQNHRACTAATINELKDVFPSSSVREELGNMANFISDREYSSTDLSDYMEKVFVDMLHVVLSQLPEAIFKEVTDSPEDEYEGRLKRAIGFLYQIELLEEKIHWSFPEGTNISRLIRSSNQTLQNEDGRNDEGELGASITATTEDVGYTVRNTSEDDVIVDVT